MEFEEKVVINALPEDIYPFYSNVSEWSSWDPEVVSSSINGPFAPGGKGQLKPKKGPEAAIEIAEVLENKSFTVISRLPFCIVSFKHELIKKGMKTEVVHSVSFSGFLSPFWGRLLGLKIKKGLPETMKGLRLAVEKLV